MIYFLLIISFLASLTLCYFLRKVGGKFCDKPSKDSNGLKIHKKPISFLGGLAIIIVVILALFLKMAQESNFNWQIFGIIIGGILVFLSGFLDDIKWKKLSQPKTKLKFFCLIIFSILATIALIFTGTKIQFFPDIILTGILTFLYVLLLINAVNFEDGIDGLAGGLVVTSLIGFFILGVIAGNTLTAIIALILLGAVLGFLVFNFPPAKIFMGDSGAYFLGFILAVLAMIFSKPYDFRSFVVPIFIIGLPIFDTGLAIVRRLFQKKSPFIGDRSHFYDRIIQKGTSIKKTVLISYFLQLILISLGIIIYFYV